MRLLGVDFGFKRIGLAVGESDFKVITPRPPLSASGSLKRDAEAIGKILAKEEADAIVLGLPLQDGDEGRMARIARQLADHLTQAGISVHLQDETLTSIGADQELRDLGLKASERRKVRDGEAAALILERYLNDKAAD